MSSGSRLEKRPKATGVKYRRNDFDVTNAVNTTEPRSVAREVRRVFLDLYGSEESANRIDQFFADAGNLYRGRYPGYLACDTWYHDLQHVLDVTLAMARLMDGYERSWIGGRTELGEDMFLLGVVCALLHDSGYLRRYGDRRHANGAEYTLTHISRGSRLIREYLPWVGMADFAAPAAKIIHFTGYEVPISQIRVQGPRFRLLGYMLGTADIIAQMSDRCYLEKCRDRLYPEFVLGGVARRRLDDGSEMVVFSSAKDLVMKTPNFSRGALHRLDAEFGAQYRYAEACFGGDNPYLEELNRNVSFAKLIASKGDVRLLRRRPPGNVASDLFPPTLN